MALLRATGGQHAYPWFADFKARLRRAALLLGIPIAVAGILPLIMLALASMPLPIVLGVAILLALFGLERLSRVGRDWRETDTEWLTHSKQHWTYKYQMHISASRALDTESSAQEADNAVRILLIYLRDPSGLDEALRNVHVTLLEMEHAHAGGQTLDDLFGMVSKRATLSLLARRRKASDSEIDFAEIARDAPALRYFEVLQDRFSGFAASDREVLRLRARYGASFRKIGRLLGVTEQTARESFKQGLVRLRGTLDTVATGDSRKSTEQITERAAEWVVSQQERGEHASRALFHWAMQSPEALKEVMLLEAIPRTYSLWRRGLDSSRGEEEPIALLPGHRVATAARILLSRDAFKRYVEPVISDMQHEYVEAVAAGHFTHARWIAFRIPLVLLRSLLYAVTVGKVKSPRSFKN